MPTVRPAAAAARADGALVAARRSTAVIVSRASSSSRRSTRSKAMLGADASADAVVAQQRASSGSTTRSRPSTATTSTGLPSAATSGRSYRTRRPVPTDLGSVRPGHARARVLRASSSRCCWRSCWRSASSLTLAAAPVCCGVLMSRARARRRSCSASSASSSSTSSSAGCPRAGASASREPADGPTGLLVVDGLLAGRLDVVGRRAASTSCCRRSCIAFGPAVAIGRVLRSSLLADDATATTPARRGPRACREGAVLRRPRAAQLRSARRCR